MRFGSPPNEGAWQPMRSSRPPSSDGTVIVASGVLAVFLGNGHVAVWPKSSRHLTDGNLPVLSGTAESKDVADKAVSIARSVKGVKSVQNTIEIKPAK